MSTRRWFGRTAIELKSERIKLNVPTPGTLVRVNGVAEDQIAVVNDIPVQGVITATVAVGGAIPTVIGTYLTYTGVDVNTFGVSTIPASSTLTITKAGVYRFWVILDIACGAAPEIPCEVWCQFEKDGLSINNASMYTNGGTAAPTRSLRFLFVHRHATTTPAAIKFEIQGDSVPNGTAITITNARVFIDMNGLSPL